MKMEKQFSIVNGRLSMVVRDSENKCMNLDDFGERVEAVKKDTRNAIGETLGIVAFDPVDIARQIFIVGVSGDAVITSRVEGGVAEGHVFKVQEKLMGCGFELVKEISI